MTKDDAQARRINSLVQLFMNSSVPLLTSFIKETLYADSSKEAFDKQYRRDRQDLALLGYVIIESSDSPCEESAWKLDAQNSLVDTNHLPKDKVLILKALLEPLVVSDSFPYRSDLLYALNKLGCLSFPTKNTVGDSKDFDLLDEVKNMRAFLYKNMYTKKRCQIHYITKDRREHHYVAEIYALFSKHQHHYISAHITEGNFTDIRDLRIDRILEANFFGESNAFTIPEEYELKQHIVLPFMIGTDSYSVTCIVPDEQKPQFASDVMNEGVLIQDGENLKWTVGVRDTQKAIRWCITHGLLPVSPQSFVDEYTKTLRNIYETG